MKEINLLGLIICFRKIGCTICTENGDFGFCFRSDCVSIYKGFEQNIYYYKDVIKKWVV